MMPSLMTHLMVGAVLFANEDTLLLTDRTMFITPARMHLGIVREEVYRLRS